MEQKENQRIRLTKKLLTDAFLKMLQEQPIHAISIRDLCEKAGINRTTFYHHYGSQYDLLNDISNRFLTQIAHQLSTADAENQESVQERVALVFHYLEDNLSISRLLLNSNADPSFAEMMRTNMLQQFAKNDKYLSIRKSAGWKEFKKKYY